MSDRLKNKIALVTGGSSGIGLAVAKRFADEGAVVFVTGRRQEDLDAAVIRIGNGARAIRADSADLSDLDRVHAVIKAETGRIDIVVANAGVLEKAPVYRITEEHFDRLFAINVKGLVFTVQKTLPLMSEGGSIILMSSTVANKGMGGNSVYAATKAAIRSFARGWIVDLKQRRIRVNVISPGPIGTRGLAGGFPDAASADAAFARMAEQIPLGRLGMPEDVADAALFLASSEAGFVNGADLQVDGGWAQI